MAVYNEILAGRFNRALQKYFGMKGPPPTPQLSSEVMAVHAFGTGVESRYLESWNRFMMNSARAAVAAQTSGVMIRNPGGSTILAVIEQIIIGSSVQNAFFLSESVTNPANLAGGTLLGQPLDTRQQGPSSTLQISFADTSPANLPDILAEYIANIAQISIISTDNQEIPLLPGSALQIVQTTVNTNLLVNFAWRERVLEEGERQ